MYLTVGFLSPRHGFLFSNFIDADDVGEWMSSASIILIAHPTITVDGQTVETSDLIPIATFDPILDRMFLRYAGERCVPDHLAKDPVNLIIEHYRKSDDT